MNVEAGSVQTEQESSGSLSLRGIAEVFYKPADFFAKLAKTPKVLVPYLLLAVLVFVLFASSSDLMMETIKASAQYQKQMEMQGGKPMPPNIEAIQKWGTVGFLSFCLMVVPLLYAALAMFWGNFVFAGKARFRQLLSVMLYSEILFTIGALLMVPLMLMKGSIFVSISLAALLPNPDLDSPLFVLLSKISLFQIWEFIVIAIGLSVVYTFPRNKGYLIAVLSVGLLALFHVLITLIKSLIL